jgi:hypothetical protein
MDLEQYSGGLFATQEEGLAGPLFRQVPELPSQAHDLRAAGRAPSKSGVTVDLVK